MQICWQIHPQTLNTGLKVLGRSGVPINLAEPEEPSSASRFDVENALVLPPRYVGLSFFRAQGFWVLDRRAWALGGGARMQSFQSFLGRRNSEQEVLVSTIL